MFANVAMTIQKGANQGPLNSLWWLKEPFTLPEIVSLAGGSRRPVQLPYGNSSYSTTFRLRMCDYNLIFKSI